MKKITTHLILAATLLIYPCLTNGSLRAQAHHDIMNLVPASQATHTAVKSGGWETAGSWNNGVPGNGAKVVIPNGIEITISSKLLTDVKWILVGGTLKFNPNVNTRLNVETVVIDMMGKLEIGTSLSPVKEGLTAHIQINTDTDINTSNDPFLVSRGIINMGTMLTCGAKKLAFSKLSSSPLAGATQLQLEKDPEGWKVGDKIVITGTRWNDKGSFADNSKNQDEVLSITKITERVIEFKNLANNGNALLYNHDGPYPEFRPYVANTTRNIIFESKNWESGIPVLRRGHLMIMHTNNASIQHTGLYGFGRVNKLIVISDADGKGSGLTNPRGRYPLHFHLGGSSDPLGKPGMVKGCVVYDSHGWGYVNHQSNVVIEDNVSFDVKGAHYVTETGNEQAVFRRNIAIKSEGAPKDGPNRNANLLGGDDARAQLKDFGTNGLGFWFETPYGIFCEDNVFASAEFAGGIIYGSSFEGHKPPVVDLTWIEDSMKYLFAGKSVIKTSHVPLRSFNNNDMFNSEGAIEIRGNMRDDMGDDVLEDVGHSKQMYLRNSKAWSLRRFGVHITYAAHVKMENWAIIGNIKNPYLRDPLMITDPEGAGIHVQKAGRHLTFINNRVEGFEAGLRVPQTAHHSLLDKHESPELGASEIIGGYFANNINHFLPTYGRQGNESTQPFIIPPPFTPWFQIKKEPYFDNVTGNTAPVSNFSYKAQAGLAVSFDGSLSSDKEYKIQVTPVLDQNDNALAAYSWDFGDGLTGWGRYPIHTYNCDGDYKVTLTVYDNQGSKSSISKTISVKGIAFPNLVKDPGFDKGNVETYGTVAWSSAFDENGIPWYNTKLNNSRWAVSGGRATAGNTGTAGGLTQVIYDQGRAYKGMLTVKYDAINTSGTKLQVKIWGVKGRGFKSSNYKNADPYNTDNYSPSKIEKILEHDVTLIQSWKTVTLNNVDFKDGYDYIVILLWTEGAGTKGFDNLFIGQGQYNNSGCTCALTATLSSTPDGGNKTGTATAQAQNGIPPFTYKWSDPKLQSTQTATGLSAGTYSVTIKDASGCAYTGQVKVDFTTGVLPGKNAVNETEVYPNPFDEGVWIKIPSVSGDKVQFSLFNLLGEQVLLNVKNSGEGLFYITAPDLAKGSYFLGISTGQGDFTVKKILKH